MGRNAGQGQPVALNATASALFNVLPSCTFKHPYFSSSIELLPLLLLNSCGLHDQHCFRVLSESNDSWRFGNGMYAILITKTAHCPISDRRGVQAVKMIEAWSHWLKMRLSPAH